MSRNHHKRIVILGAGTAGTIVANRLAKKARSLKLDITVVDQNERHYYQPGFLFYPFGIYQEKDIVKKRSHFINRKVNYIQSVIEKIDNQKRVVKLKHGKDIHYDVLVIATGSQIAPQETPGMLGPQWHKSIYDFYSFEGASALREKLAKWRGGTLVVNITEMPIKCPVAPLEFCFLADWFFEQKGMRDKVEIKFVTPLDGAFTKPQASQSLGYLLKEKNVEIIPDFSTGQIDAKKKQLISYDDRKVDYDLLVTIPTNMGDPLLQRSGLGDELNYVPTHPNTLQAKNDKHIFVVGDATDVPASKAGSVAHFESDVVVDNIERFLKNEPLAENFDGHANCFVETGHKKALLIDFNYDVEPLKGKFPFAIIGPLKLLRESRLNHLGKLAFRWIYWNMLLKARPLPGIPVKMSRAGKEFKTKKGAV